jgi:UDP-N-acetylglucosamine 2-epimerase
MIKTINDKTLENISNNINEILNEVKNINSVLNNQTEKINNISNNIDDTNNKLKNNIKQINKILSEEKLNFVNGISGGIIIGSGIISLLSPTLPIIGTGIIISTGIIFSVILINKFNNVF